ncbi:MAG: oxidoreductase [Gammaproteobacteria bacterium]|nr:oxidoreductase [Gammaproteobacteria bacterium]
MRLKNKTAIVTGATGGIGTATSKRYLEEGANLVMVGRSEEKLMNLMKSLDNPSNALTCVADSKDESAINKCINTTYEKFGSVDIVMANAGTEGIVKPLTDFTVEEFNDVIDVNVVGVWLYMKYAFPIMQKQKSGSFIAVASTAGLVGFNGLCPYIASKHAVCGMVKTACLENGPMNVRVNALAPGPVDNRMMASLGEQLNPDDPSSVVDMVNGMVATNRYSTNEEIANLALFLGSDESSNCSGSVYVCDGGFTAA